MDKFVITGGHRLKGEVTVSGAKNAVVAILPATILAEDVCRIENIPNISDVTAMLNILSNMGASIKFINNSTKIILKAIRDVRPLKFFGWPGIFLVLVGLILGLVFLGFYFQDFKIRPYLNYIIFSSIFLFLGLQLIVFALIADMIKSNRKITEEILYQWKKDRYKR